MLYNISKRFGIDMAALFEADPQAFVNQMGSSQFCDDDLMELVSFYKKLSPFAKGMLMERAMYLLDWDRFREESQRALDEKKSEWEGDAEEDLF